MKSSRLIGIFGLIFLVAVGIGSSAFTVAETEQALITQFGEPVGEPITEAGLHWRTPFVQKVHRFEKRLLEHDGDADQITTREKKNIFLDTFARWRIVDPLLFYRRVQNEAGAKSKLNDIIDSETRDTISRHFLLEAVRNTNRELLQDAEIAAAAAVTNIVAAEGGAVPPREVDPNAIPVPLGDNEHGPAEPQAIELGREALTREILQNAKAKVHDFGIDLVDIQIKSINYVAKVQEAVFMRMVSERQQIAEKYRAEGKRFLSEWQGRIQKERDRILSEAYRKAETIRGEAEAEAARIYAEAYGADPEFYAFWRSLELYKNHFSENVSLVIGTDSDLFRYLKGAGTLAK